jgi:hypothetical protein
LLLLTALAVLATGATDVGSTKPALNMKATLPMIRLLATRARAIDANFVEIEVFMTVSSWLFR